MTDAAEGAGLISDEELISVGAELFAMYDREEQEHGDAEAG